MVLNNTTMSDIKVNNIQCPDQSHFLQVLQSDSQGWMMNGKLPMLNQEPEGDVIAEIKKNQQ